MVLIFKSDLRLEMVCVRKSGTPLSNTRTPKLRTATGHPRKTPSVSCSTGRRGQADNFTFCGKCEGSFLPVSRGPYRAVQTWRKDDATSAAPAARALCIQAAHLRRLSVSTEHSRVPLKPGRQTGLSAPRPTRLAARPTQRPGPRSLFHHTSEVSDSLASSLPLLRLPSQRSLSACPRPVVPVRYPSGTES